MSLNQAQIESYFKRFGKLINVSQRAATGAETLQVAIAGAAGQENDADTTSYQAITESVQPLHNDVKGVINSTTNLTTSAKRAVELLLRNVMAPDLGLARNASLAVVGSGLVAAMNSASCSVAASGGNEDGFGAYFGANFSIVLPTSGSPNIDDAWIDSEVV